MIPDQSESLDIRVKVSIFVINGPCTYLGEENQVSSN